MVRKAEAELDAGTAALQKVLSPLLAKWSRSSLLNMFRSNRDGPQWIRCEQLNLIY